MEDNRKGFIIGFIAGTAIGLVATIFIASRIRREMRRRGMDLERGREFVSRARDIVRQGIEEGRKAATKARSDIEESLRKESGQ